MASKEICENVTGNIFLWVLIPFLGTEGVKEVDNFNEQYLSETLHGMLRLYMGHNTSNTCCWFHLFVMEGLNARRAVDIF
jgi:hypothetical protein